MDEFYEKVSFGLTLINDTENTTKLSRKEAKSILTNIAYQYVFVCCTPLAFISFILVFN